MNDHGITDNRSKLCDISINNLKLLFSGILRSRNSAAEYVKWILATDATPTTGQLGLIKVDSVHYLTGHEHEPNDCTKVNIQNNGETDVMVLEDGTINGLEVFPKMKRLNVIKEATLVSSFILVPLCESSFTYCLATHPVSKGFTAEKLRAAYQKIIRVAESCNVEIISLVGDGDSRLRSIQVADNHHVPTELTWLSKEEFPLQRGLSVTTGGIAMQDCLHLIKKMRNNIKYLTTKLLILCPSAEVTFETRFKYSIRWDIILEMYKVSDSFRDAVTLSSVVLTDKQDPSAVTELAYTYQLFYEHGFQGMGLWLEIIYLTFCSFYDKSLSPEMRMTYASIVKTVVITWREAAMKSKTVTKHFVTHPTYQDFITGIDGLICYLGLCATKYSDQPIVPWLITSDVCEQFFAFLRIGRYKGRRTNLSSLDVIQGAAKSNRNVELDSSGLHLLQHTVAHTRGKTLLPHSQETRVFYGRETSRSKLKRALRDGVEDARELLQKHTLLSDLEYVKENEIEEFELEESDDGLEDDEVDLEVCDVGSESMVTSSGKSYHLRSAEQKFLNDGRKRMCSQTRNKRIKGVTTTRTNVELQCSYTDGSCRMFHVGDSGRFLKKASGRSKNKDPINVSGQSVFLSVTKIRDSDSVDRSSVCHSPVNSLCTVHTGSYVVWVKNSVTADFDLCFAVL